MEARSKARAAALLAAAAGALGGLGVATTTGAAASAEFQRVLEQQNAERKADLQRQQQHREAQFRAFMAGKTGGWRAPNLKVLAKTGWTNASYRRAARKRKNVQRNRRAHRG